MYCDCYGRDNLVEVDTIYPITTGESKMLTKMNEQQTAIGKALSLHHYAPISLSKMKHIALQNRTDTKYVLPVTTLQRIMAALVDEYATLVVKGQRMSEYRTLYFDTAGFDLYRRHHAGALDRYKVRSREYVESEIAFLEVKHKINKGRTIKNRIQTPQLVAEIDADTAVFLQNTYPHDAAALEPKLWVEYSRITLASLRHKERVTIDLNLRYAWEGETVALPHLAIVEVKQEGIPRQSAIAQQLRQHRIHQTGFSKYCVGISMLYPQLKHNNFKTKLRLVEKLAGEHHVNIH